MTEPIITDESPQDIVNAHKSGQIDRTEMLDKLRDYPYTWGTFYGYDAYIPGTIDELIQLSIEGEIDEAELLEIIAKQDN